MKHWSENEDFLVVHHGTHIRNVSDILKNGIKNKDPKTGMVSVAIGDRGKQVAKAYAAMAGAGGEYNYRTAGQRPVNVPPEHRAVIVAHLPMYWVRQNVDTTFGGNSDAVKERLRNPAAHNAFVAKNGEDTKYDETMELRFSKPIPHEFIQKDNNENTKYVTGESKEQPMKTFKEFVEESLSEEVPTTSAGGGGDSKIKNFDPVLKFNNIVSMLKRRPLEDTFNNDPKTRRRLSSIGVPGLP
jgi:hypothetical protein